MRESLSWGHRDLYTQVWQNILVVSLSTTDSPSITSPQSLFIVPDSVELLSLLGKPFISYFENLSPPFNWQRLAGARIISINGEDPYSYVDTIASTVSGNYLSHAVRVNSVYSSYWIVAGTDPTTGEAIAALSQRVGDLAGPPLPDLDSLDMVVRLVGSNVDEKVTIPYATNYLGTAFTDGASYWATNCAVESTTNGVNFNAVSSPPAPNTNIIPALRPTLSSPHSQAVPPLRHRQKANIVTADSHPVSAVNLPPPVLGGIGEWIPRYLYIRGFVSTQRGNALAQKLVTASVNLKLNDTNYSPLNWAFLNDVPFPLSHNYDQPLAPFVINGKQDPTSQRFHDICTPFDVPIPKTPPFPLDKIAIIGNANCASTCAMFITLMAERQGVKTAVWGGIPGDLKMEFKGMAGNQVLEWFAIDSEVKTALLKDDPLAAPDLFINGNLRHNWRTAWSFLNEDVPIAYVSEPAKFRFAYTNETYNNPQNLWTFAASQLF